MACPSGVKLEQPPCCGVAVQGVLPCPSPDLGIDGAHWGGCVALRKLPSWPGLLGAEGGGGAGPGFYLPCATRPGPPREQGGFDSGRGPPGASGCLARSCRPLPDHTGGRG